MTTNSFKHNLPLNEHLSYSNALMKIKKTTGMELLEIKSYNRTQKLYLLDNWIKRTYENG